MSYIFLDPNKVEISGGSNSTFSKPGSIKAGMCFAILLISQHKLGGLEYADSTRFCKLDIKNFFMSRDAYILSDLASAPFRDTPMYALLKESIFFLLQHQHVLDPLQGVVYKVVRGSGMGLPHSGAVAEMALMSAVELSLIRRLREYQILFFGRFKDDVCILFNNIDRLRSFVDAYKVGPPFKVLCESIDRHAIHFWECRVERCGPSHRVFPVSKPSSLNSPWLSRSSAHFPSVHASWPLSRLKSRLSLCSSLELKKREGRFH
jgi:hypothetical protein